MKKFKEILGMGVAFVICVVTVYSLGVRYLNVYGVEDTVIEDYNYEEYYVYDVE
jgi:hypothetical protein